MKQDTSKNSAKIKCNKIFEKQLKLLRRTSGPCTKESELYALNQPISQSERQS